MSKYILIPDSFKGSLSSGEICGILGREIRALEPEAEICSIPVADGGEGTVDAFLAALGGEKIPVSCREPYGHHRLLRPFAGRRHRRDRNGCGGRPAPGRR